MLLEQKERIIKIVEAIDGLPNSTRIKGLLYPPENMDNIDLPALLPIAKTVRYDRKSAKEHLATCHWELYLFTRKLSEASNIQSDSEPLAFLDVIATAFLSRPKLQFNDTRLQYVRDSEFTNWQKFNDGISYPLNSGNKYRGMIGNLIVQYNNITPLNISGA